MKNLPRAKQWVFVSLTCFINMVFALSLFSLQSHASTQGYFHTSGNQILDSNGEPAQLNGVAWFGFETNKYYPHGLWARSMDDVLDQLHTYGYNLLRIPYSNDIFTNKRVSGIDTNLNPDLKGLNSLQILDKLVEKAGARGMKIVLDRHRPNSRSQSELWYTRHVSEQRWITDWEALARRYLGNDTVIGADLHNEPHGEASWGTGDLATDWRLAAERAGNAILAINPNWLILVEGVEHNVAGTATDDYYWWGGNLRGVRDYPVRLNVDGRLVYSSHDYGPGVYNQNWFSDPAFPENMPALWDTFWGYIHKEGIAPVLVGEFGGRDVGYDTTEGVWQNKLVDYIGAHQMYWAYWCLNPNSGDTGGLLQDDWHSWQVEKQNMLNRIIQ